ncbi:MAG TPA: PilN domain-containing protein [Phycisphaerae bacterium]|nr:PilN domain-containing protein [Phycisphaerae bacterium]HNU46643.1 PilN domain-containing protein [Phycisphaerae bacterium]
MKTLDFTPVWYREALVRRGQRHRRAIWLLLIVGALGTWTLTLQMRLHLVRRDLATLAGIRLRQEPLVTQAATVQAELERAALREARLADLCGGLRLHRVVAELANCLPESAVLHALTVKQEPRVASSALSASAAAPVQPGGTPPLNTVLVGYALRAPDVGRFVNALAESAVFRDVQLQYSRPAETNGVAVREFEIQCYLPQFE